MNALARGLAALGAEMGSAEMQTHARLANTYKPQLRTHDRFGHRTDVVEFHPSYHALIGTALRHGLHATPWSRQDTGHAHTERAAGFMLFTEAEPSVLCPVSMSYAVTPALRGNSAVWADWSKGLASTQYDPRLALFSQKSALTMGMGMTEKQGGSDVRANTTQAVHDGEDAWGARYRITGHKWFFSAPMCDAFLVLAQAPAGATVVVVTDGEEEGIDAEKDVLDQSVEAGVVVSSLGLFWRAEGTANVGRAKDYLGSRLTTRDFGVFESVPLNNAKTAAERVASFAARYTRSIEQSGLIVPDGPPAASDLVVETEAPVVGDPDKTEAVPVRTLDWLVEAQRRGAGEIVLNCMDSDGVRRGYDVEQLRQARALCQVPLIASGGAGLQHLASCVMSESMPTTSTPPLGAVSLVRVFLSNRKSSGCSTGSGGRSTVSMLRSENSSLPTTSNKASADLKPSCTARSSSLMAVLPSRCKSFSTDSRPRATVSWVAWALNHARTLALARWLVR